MLLAIDNWSRLSGFHNRGAFDRSAVDFPETMDVSAYKVASLEITDLPLIEYIASKGKSVIISTGIATLSDNAEAIDACKRAHNEQVIILKCTTEYPPLWKM